MALHLLVFAATFGVFPLLGLAFQPLAVPVPALSAGLPFLCASLENLVTGIPMAVALFGGTLVGVMVLPPTIFHQMQLMACATFARRHARGRDAEMNR